MDLRLDGKQLYRFALYPHAGSWQAADVPGWAMSVTRPPLVIVAAAKKPVQPMARTFLAIQNPGIVPTAVVPAQRSNQVPRNVAVRFYESTGKVRGPKLMVRSSQKATPARLTDLGGRAVSALRPWLISQAEIALK